MRRLHRSLSAVLSLAVAGPALWALTPPADAATGASVRITEIAYGGLIPTGADGEYVELTNIGDAPQDMSTWLFDSDVAGTTSLAGLGTIAPGESVIVSDAGASTFRAEWGLRDSVDVVSDGTQTLKKTGTVSISDGTSTVDSMTYTGLFTDKGQGARVDAAHVDVKAGTAGWSLATVGDAEGSWMSSSGSVGSPGASIHGTSTPADVRVSDGGGPGGGETPVTDPNAMDIVINEVSSDNVNHGFDPLPAGKDLIELYNTGDAPVSLAGWKQLDSTGDFSTAGDLSTSLYVDGSTATSIPAHGYGVFQSLKGLGSGGDAVRIWAPDGTLVDSLTYTAGQAGVDETVNTGGTYQALASCPNGGDMVLEVPTASFGADNTTACADGVPPLTGGNGPEATCDTEDAGSAPGTVPTDAAAWPGSPTPGTIDSECAWVTSLSGQDLSGLAFDPNDADVLYAVKNKSHVWRLVRSGSTWVKDTTNGWSAGKDLRFPAPNTSGLPDSEGLTVGPDGALYVTTERDNAASGVPLDSILRFDPTLSATTLVATDQWVLTPDLGFSDADANLGFEGVAFVPDGFLTASGFRTDAGALYDPADYPGKAVAGLLLGAVEKTGHLRAYVLNTDHTWTRVADVDTGLVGVMDASFDPDLGRVWAHCDNTCGNATALLEVGAGGRLAVDRSYRTPVGLPNYNLEGFAVAPYSTGTDGSREVLWADDGNRFAHSLWSGTIDLDLGLGQVRTPTPSIAGSPVVGRTLTATVGTWDAGVTTRYTWKDGDTVLGTDSPLVLGPSLAGRTITLAVTGSRAGFTDVTRTASATVQSPTPPSRPVLTGPAPTIVGTPTFGQTLTAVVGAWDAGVTTHYVWRAGTTVLATDGPLTLGDASLVGRTITLTVTATNAGYDDATRTASVTVSPATLEASVPRISGEPRVGRTLRVTAAWGPSPVDLTFAWFADGTPIPGASGSSLVLEPAQTGTSITVRVTGTRAGYATESRTSDATAQVVPGVIDSAKPTVSGVAKVGRTLTVDAGDWSAGGDAVGLGYQWFADGRAIKRATSDRLELTKKLRGARITVTVTGSAVGFTSTERTSKPTPKVR